MDLIHAKFQVESLNYEPFRPEFSGLRRETSASSVEPPRAANFEPGDERKKPLVPEIWPSAMSREPNVGEKAGGAEP